VNVVLPSIVIKAPIILNIAQLVNKKNGQITETVNNFSGTIRKGRKRIDTLLDQKTKFEVERLRSE